MGHYAPTSVEEQIAEVEGFVVVLRALDGTDPAERRLDPYPYERAARKSWNVARWREERIEAVYPGFTADVYGPDDSPIHGATLLENLRARWLEADEAEEAGDDGQIFDPGPAQPKEPKARKPRAPKAKNASGTEVKVVEDYEHPGASRTNIPPAGLAHLDRDDTPVVTLAYDPHLDPQLVWAGKAERATVEVPAPSIHVHEELSAQKIVGSVRRQRLQQALFDVDRLDADKAVEFYKHELGWSNRMILGDSLVVMTSLLERERLAGQVQCVFMDPPYGIKYQSNFQPRIGDRAVSDGKDDSLTREPEMIQAYRDTWELGVHSYLTYLRDRLHVVRELLAESGSVFVQIGEENVHRVRVLMDEVFGAENYCSQITFATTSSAGSPGELKVIPATTNYLVWYAKDRSALKYRQLYLPKSESKSLDATYSMVELPEGTRRRLTSEERSGASTIPEGARVFTADNLTSQSGVDTTRYPVEVDGVEYRPGKGVWKTGRDGMDRLVSAGRVVVSGKSLRYVRYLDDFSAFPLGNLWTDSSGGSPDKRYVVQTNPKVIARCILMTTDPGDLVLDPTCGSGTSATVAEQYGRRWITVDTSRVAMSIARERLLTSTFPYYQLRDAQRDVDGGFEFETLQRVTLRSIARGEDPEQVTLVDKPKVDKGTTRVSGPFTVEALSRYAVTPADEHAAAGPTVEEAADHVETLLEALRSQGIPRPGGKPARIVSLTQVASAGALQGEGVVELDGRQARFAVSLGPQFGAVTMAQVSDALKEAIGFELVVFAGYAFSADAEEKLGTGTFGNTAVSLLKANPDLLVGDLLKNTKSSQTFRLYSRPDVRVEWGGDGYRVSVDGVDSFDAATGEVVSYGRNGVQAWFLDDDYDGNVFRVAQAFFPVSNSWEKLQRALRGTVDAELLEEFKGWTSLPFDGGDHGKVAVRVVADDGNESEIVLPLPKA